MRDTMGIIYSGGGEEQLKELTRSRSIAAVPFAGRYRMIDFILSNMVNSGIYNVGLIAQNNYHSLMDHLDSGKQWDLNRKRDGLFILPPYVSRDNTGWYKGKIDALHNIMAYIRRSTQQYVVISDSNMVCNLTYDDALEFHKENKADITVIYKEEKDALPTELSRFTLIQTDENNRVCNMEVMPSTPKWNKVSMEMYILEKNLMEHLVEESVARGQHDFTKEILIRKMDELRIFAYPYEGYLAKIDSVQSFFKYNMELLDADNREDLFYHCGSIYTKVKDEVPAKYGEHCKVSNSMIADGCIVEGEIENCMLFRGVRIAKGAVLKDSIVMQNTEIQENAYLENAIMDKDVVIRRGRRLIGQESYPVVIGKRAII
ncbi:MAG: glucose-1-phosphate adenylyltransferase subunit GlgD [Clostridiales bacterium]|nr:glucose-1-phosphate adenylyltransferase subunit GlgD [Clostridiales bacterium]